MSCVSNIVTKVCLVGYSTFKTDLGPRDMFCLSSLKSCVPPRAQELQVILVFSSLSGLSGLSPRCLKPIGGALAVEAVEWRLAGRQQ